MSSLSSWLGYGGDLSALPTATEQQRAALAWRAILDKPVSVVFRTPAGVPLAAQTVRIESDNKASDSESAAGKAPSRYVIIFGVKNHALKASTVPDTVMEEGYTFILNRDSYRVTDVIETLGERQGTAEATG